jgi:hypothetical protein
MFSNTYATYQLGKIAIVANSHLTTSGQALLAEFALRDGLLFLVAFVLFSVIVGGSAAKN